MNEEKCENVKEREKEGERGGRWRRDGGRRENETENICQTNPFPMLKSFSLSLSLSLICEFSYSLFVLSPVHRAAAVVIIHYLYRRYCLGHTHISDNYALLYANLKSIRRGVEPLYAFVVVK